MIDANDHCLIIEDNFVILTDLEDMVKSAGFKFVHQAVSLVQLQERLGSTRYRMGFLDLYLQSGSSVPIAKMLKKHNIPFALTTAYYEENSLPALLKGIPVIQKPYSSSTVNRVVLELLRPTKTRSKMQQMSANH